MYMYSLTQTNKHICLPPARTPPATMNISFMCEIYMYIHTYIRMYIHTYMPISRQNSSRHHLRSFAAGGKGPCYDRPTERVQVSSAHVHVFCVASISGIQQSVCICEYKYKRVRVISERERIEIFVLC